MAETPISAGTPRSDLHRVQAQGGSAPLRVPGAAGRLDQLADRMTDVLSAKLNECMFRRVEGTRGYSVLVLSRTVDKTIARVECQIRPSGEDVYLESTGYVLTPVVGEVVFGAACHYLLCCFAYARVFDLSEIPAWVSLLLWMFGGAILAAMTWHLLVAVVQLATQHEIRFNPRVTDNATSAVNEMTSAIGHAHAEILATFGPPSTRPRRRI